VNVASYAALLFAGSENSYLDSNDLWLGIFSQTLSGSERSHFRFTCINAELGCEPGLPDLM
jgi:hypothetical protein